MRGGGAGSVLRIRIAATRAGGQRQQAGGTKSHERTSFHRDLLNSGDIVSLYNRAGILKIFMKVAPLPHGGSAMPRLPFHPSASCLLLAQNSNMLVTPRWYGGHAIVLLGRFNVNAPPR